jgi:hypothetical protein
MGKHLKEFAFRSIYQTMHWLIVFLIGVLIYPESAVAQQDTDLPTYKLEEITVIGERPLHSLQMEINKAEDIKVKLFNSLNSTNDFDMKCEYVARTEYNSNIKRWECDVNYMKKARTEDARLFMDYREDYTFLLQRSGYQLVAENAGKTEALNKKMIQLAVKHPSLAKAMINEYALKQLYIAEWRERFKDSILIGHTKPEGYFGDELKFLDFAYVAYKSGMLEEQIWNYWDKRLRSVIHQEPYRTIWLSSDIKTYSFKFIGYVTAILWG